MVEANRSLRWRWASSRNVKAARLLAPASALALVADLLAADAAWRRITSSRCSLVASGVSGTTTPDSSTWSLPMPFQPRSSRLAAVLVGIDASCGCIASLPQTFRAINERFTQENHHHVLGRDPQEWATRESYPKKQ